MPNFLTISGRVLAPKGEVLSPRHEVVIEHKNVICIQADSAHPNKLNFKGILVRLDEPSTKPPQGANGHQIQLPSEVAQKRLRTLIGMGVNYAENLDSHDPAYKVGVIDKAWVKGNALWVSGYVWVGDFPDAEKVLSTPGMGMSMELTRVKVDDENADIWLLTDFVFTGATFLRKTNAAYYDTQAIAASAARPTTISIYTEAEMPNKIATTKTPTKTPKLTAEQKESARLAASASSAAIAKALGVPLAGIVAALEKSNTLNQAILAKLDEEEPLKAGMDDDADDDIEAGKKPKTDDSSDDDWDESDDDDDDEDDDEDDVDSTGDDDLDKPGDINDDDPDRGNTTELEDKQGPTVSASAVAELALWKKRALELRASNKDLKVENKRLRARGEQADVRLNATSRETVRRSLSAEAISLLSKNGIAAEDMKASGQMLSPDEVDAMIRNVGITDVEQRLALKLQLKAAGVMKAPEARRRSQ